MKWYLMITMFLFVLTGCATTTRQHPVDSTNLGDLQNLSQQHLKAGTSMAISKMRAEALQEVALTIGAQGGLSKRAGQIDRMLEHNKLELSRIFDFNSLLLENHVLPPVMQESKQSLSLNSSDVIRASSRTYKIIKQARFVTTAPTWRDYLWLNYPKPDLPDRTLLPRNKQEREIWVKFVNIGWKKGIEQANNIHADHLAKIKGDFKGMLLYRKLLAHNMVSKPFVAKSNLGITSNADHSEIQINDQILRITATPSINADSNQWKPVIAQ